MPYKDKEKQKAYWREYQRTQKRKDYKRKWLAARPEKVARYREGVAKRKAEDPERFRSYFRNRHVMKTYGVTTEWYNEKFAKQGGVCAICGGSPDIHNHGITRLAIDHSHITGKVRELLCNGCNVGLGSFGDSPERLELAAQYLRNHRQ